MRSTVPDTVRSHSNFRFSGMALQKMYMVRKDGDFALIGLRAGVPLEPGRSDLRKLKDGIGCMASSPLARVPNLIQTAA